MAISNYTTKIDFYKTIGEIQKDLAEHGARKIVVDYDDSGLPVSLTFAIDWKGQMIFFALPCNYRGVLRAMEKAKVTRSLCTEEQALRVSWRIIKDWVQAQMAIVEADVAGMAEVFLPYAVTQDGSTLYNHLLTKGSNLLLSAGEAK
jgi:hypothetical protein